MLTPKLRVAVIARALLAPAESETSTVGGSADTEAKAVTVIPHGWSPIQQVTNTTPLASALIASAKSSAGVGVMGCLRWKVTGFLLCRCWLVAAVWGRPPTFAVVATPSSRPR